MTDELVHTTTLRYVQEVVTNQTGSTDTLLFALEVYGSIFVVGFIVYCYVRKRFPRTYAVRQWVPEIKSPAADDQFGYLDWLWKVYLFSAEELLQEIGLDALCFLRLINMGFRLAFVGALNTIWLFPVYATAEEKPVSSIGEPINLISFNNLADGSPRFLATVVASYIFFGYAMYTILKECNWFLSQRHLWLRKFKQRNFSIMVRQIPEELRSNDRLLGHFQRLFGPKNVLEAHVLHHMRDLEALTLKRATTVAKLEHALAQYATTGKRPKKLHLFQSLGHGLKSRSAIDTIDYYMTELNNMNYQIRAKIEQLEKREVNETSNEAKDTSLNAHPEDQLPFSSGVCAPVETSRSDGVISALSCSDPVEPPITGNEVEGSTPLTATCCKPSTHGIPHPSGKTQISLNPSAPQVATKLMIDDMASSVSNEKYLECKSILATCGSSSCMKGEENDTLGGAGFVTFTSMLSAQGALQLNHRPEPFAMKTSPADDPRFIFWSNVDKSTAVLQFGRFLSVVITMVICFFWTFVVTFVVNLTNVEEIPASVPLVSTTVDSYTLKEIILPLLSPLLLSIINSFLPVILKAVTRLEFPASDSLLEASAFWKMAAFTIIQTFFVSLISGSIVQELREIIESPKEFVTLLAVSLPQQSIYFMKLLIVSTCLGTLTELLRVVPLIYSIVRAHIGWRLTEKERNKKFGIFRPLSDVDKCYYSRLHAVYLLYFIVMFVYTAISPLVNWFCLVLFCLISSVYRHQFIFNYPSCPDSGGKIFLPFVECLLACMVIGELTIAAFLALKRTLVAGPLMIPLLIWTILFIVYVKESHFAAGTFLAASICMEDDAANQALGVDFNQFENSYKHPALIVLDVQADCDPAIRSSSSNHSAGLDCEENGNDIQEIVARDSDQDANVDSGEILKPDHSLGRRELFARFWSLK